MLGVLHRKRGQPCRWRCTCSETFPCDDVQFHYATTCHKVAMWLVAGSLAKGKKSFADKLKNCCGVLQTSGRTVVVACFQARRATSDHTTSGYWALPSLYVYETLGLAVYVSKKPLCMVTAFGRVGTVGTVGLVGTL